MSTSSSKRKEMVANEILVHQELAERDVKGEEAILLIA